MSFKSNEDTSSKSNQDTSSKNNEEMKKSMVIAILNHSIDQLNNLNKSLHDTTQINYLTPSQEKIFFDIYLSVYQRLKQKSNDIITYNSNNNNYNIKLSYESHPQDRIINFTLTENEFIKLIIDSILFAMFKYKNDTVWTLDLYDNNVLVSNPLLKRNYHYLMAKLVTYIFEPKQLSIQLQQLADDYIIPQSEEEYVLHYDPNNLVKPPNMPGGKKTIKRKYSPTKSSSGRRKRRKLYSYKRNKRKRVKTPKRN